MCSEFISLWGVKQKYRRRVVIIATARKFEMSEATPIGSLIGHRGPVNDVIVSESGNLVATSSDDGTVRLWDSRTQKAIKCYTSFFTGAPVYLKFSPGSDDGCLYASDDSSVFELDLRASGVLVREPRGIFSFGASGINCISLSSDYIAVGSDDGDILLTRIIASEDLIRLSGIHTNLVGSLALFQDDDASWKLISGGFDAILAKWDVAGSVSEGTINFSEFSPGGTNPPFVHSLSIVSLNDPNDYVVCALGNGELKLISCDDMSISASMECSGGMLAACHSVGRTVCVAANSGTIKGYDIASSEVRRTTGSKSGRRRLRRKGNTMELKHAFEEKWTISGLTNKANAVFGHVQAPDSALQVVVADVSNDVSIFLIR